jgi:RNA polymerase sigma factor (sigma-70 family)
MLKDGLADVVRGAASGDQGAWTALVTQHQDLLRGVARGYRLSEAQVDDAVQTTWLRLVEHLGSLREPERVTGWLVTTLRRECLSTVRAARREQPTLTDEDDFWGQVGAVEDDVMRDSERQRVREAITHLPDRQRRVLTVLAWSPDLDYQEVSRSLEMPVGSIGPTRGRALARLRQLLDTPAAPPAAA